MQERRSRASSSLPGSPGPRTSRRQEPARLPALQRRRVGWPGSRVPGGSGAGEARGPGRRGAERSRAEQPRPPPPGRAQPSRESGARAQRRASAAPEGRARVRVHPPAADPALPRALPPPAAPRRWLSTLRPGVSTHPGRGTSSACPRGRRTEPFSARSPQAQPRSGARYLGRSEMAWPRSTRGAADLERLKGAGLGRESLTRSRSRVLTWSWGGGDERSSGSPGPFGRGTHATPGWEPRPRHRGRWG